MKSVFTKALSAMRGMHNRFSARRPNWLKGKASAIANRLRRNPRLLIGAGASVGAGLMIYSTQDGESSPLAMVRNSDSIISGRQGSVLSEQHQVQRERSHKMAVLHTQIENGLSKLRSHDGESEDISFNHNDHYRTVAETILALQAFLSIVAGPDAGAPLASEVFKDAADFAKVGLCVDTVPLDSEYVSALLSRAEMLEEPGEQLDALARVIGISSGFNGLVVMS